MPKGIYPHLHIKPKVYPASMVHDVKHLYLSEGKSQVEVATLLGVTLKVIYKLMINHEIPRRPQIKRDQWGEKNVRWKGPDASYSAFHFRVERARGKRHLCNRCGRSDDAATYDWANLTGNYHDVNDYERMCRSCHRKFDKQKRLEGDAQCLANPN
jgi:hypothetical protein